MSALRYYYSDTISRFLTKNTEEIIGKLTLASQHDINDDTSNSWVEEIETLRRVLTPYKERGSVYFEYNIPRMGRRAEIIPGLELYGCYNREEVFTLVGRQTAEVKMQGAASGVFNLPEHNATLLFVTLNKSEKDFSPSTQYNDYLINEEYFHWQSQNTDSHNNNGGRRYTEQTQTKNKIILFVREEKKDGFGNTSPFHCFGLVDYVSSHDDFPMNVTWKLHKPAMAQYLKAI